MMQNIITKHSSFIKKWVILFFMINTAYSWSFYILVYYRYSMFNAGQRYLLAFIFFLTIPFIVSIQQSFLLHHFIPSTKKWGWVTFVGYFVFYIALLNRFWGSSQAEFWQYIYLLIGLAILQAIAFSNHFGLWRGLTWVGVNIALSLLIFVLGTALAMPDTKPQIVPFMYLVGQNIIYSLIHGLTIALLLDGVSKFFPKEKDLNFDKV